MNPVAETLADGHHWLRVADASWTDPLDPSFAAREGGRWNPPGSHPTLYLNEDMQTARSQIVALLHGSPIDPDDLDSGYDLIVATLPRRQEVADAIDDDGLAGLGLPASYPRYRNGRPIRHDVCQPIGKAVYDAGLRGVHARSAATEDGLGRELAWFPARESSRATMVQRLSYRQWWHSPIE